MLVAGLADTEHIMDIEWAKLTIPPKHFAGYESEHVQYVYFSFLKYFSEERTNAQLNIMFKYKDIVIDNIYPKALRVLDEVDRNKDKIFR